MRLDILERMETVLVDASKLKTNADEVLNLLISLLGCGQGDAMTVVNLLGWRRATREIKSGDTTTTVAVWQRTKGPGGTRHQRSGKPVKPDSPFARLADLIDVD